MTFDQATPISVSTPARLHFGLFSIGDRTRLQFGGAGMMIDQPRTTIVAQPAKRLSFHDAESRDRLLPTIEKWYQSNRMTLPQTVSPDSADLPFQFRLASAAPSHSGFGSGTQRAMATALLLTRLHSLPAPSASDLALSVGRGRRSAIGTHGFLQGGFLVDEGKDDAVPISPLDLRVEFPEAWRVVTFLPKSRQVVFGDEELAAFRDLPATTEAERDEMTSLMKKTIVPALIRNDYVEFGEALHEFGFRAGQMFAPIQGGPYNGHEITSLVKTIRDLGVPAVGQSSWGACVYAITESEAAAIELVRHIEKQKLPNLSIQICRGDNRGASVTTGSNGD